MRRRYLAAYRHQGLAAACRDRLRATACPTEGFWLLIDDAEFVLIAEADVSVIRLGEGAILGSVFARGSATSVAAFASTDVAAITASRGGHLTAAYWGAYVALLIHPDGALEVVRAPFGDLGCYHLREDGGILLASDAALLRNASRTPLIIDRAALARTLACGEMTGEETCLAGVCEIRGGDRVTFGPNGTMLSTMLWSPWHFTDGQFDDAAEAARRVRETVRLAIRAVIPASDAMLLLLSGGLDSSIIAACLRAAAAQFSCVTLVTADRSGDERHYARLAADAAGAPLAMLYRDGRAVDLTHSAAAMLPRPTARSFTQESERSTASLATACHAKAIVDGGGGDNVFCSHRSVAAVADCLLTRGFGRRFLATARALGGLTDTGLPAVGVRAIRRAWFRDRATRSARDTTLLSKAAVAAAMAHADHPWLAAPANALPGKAVHIALLAVAQTMVESTYAAEPIPRLSPLASQPIVETCLRVPSWLWFAPGRDRATARRAFATDLPAAIIDRRSKGSPNLFAASLIELHRARLRALLLDGVLADDRLLDVDAVRTLLDDPAPARTHNFTRLLRLADVEAWARCWR